MPNYHTQHSPRAQVDRPVIRALPKYRNRLAQIMRLTSSRYSPLEFEPRQIHPAFLSVGEKRMWETSAWINVRYFADRSVYAAECRNRERDKDKRLSI